jgi:polysaccharide biosynthesis/export protein
MRYTLGLMVLFLVSILSSCSTSKHVNYFSNYPIDSSHTYILQSFEVPIQLGDQLNIVVTALNPQSALPYNFPIGTKGTTVDPEGKIIVPQLGSIKVEGLTKSQLRDLLMSRLKPFLTDPVVLVEFVNFKVTVLGEVGKPGVVAVPDAKLNILEALAQAGDLTDYGKQYPIMVIRENKGRREFGYLNLNSHSIFTSPYFRLQQNDIIYVPTVENKPTVNEEIAQRRFTFYSSIITLATTVAFFFFTYLINK